MLVLVHDAQAVREVAVRGGEAVQPDARDVARVRPLEQVQQHAAQAFRDPRAVALEHVPRDGTHAAAHDQQRRVQHSELAERGQVGAQHAVALLRAVLAERHQRPDYHRAYQLRRHSQHLPNLAGKRFGVRNRSQSRRPPATHQLKSLDALLLIVRRHV